MKSWIHAAAGAALALAASTAAADEMFKCKRADGKIIFTDRPCEAGTVDLNKAAAAAAPAPAKPAAGGRYELTDADRERIKVLEAIMEKKASNAEQKTAAQLEIFNIRRGAEVTLTPEQRAKRDALTAALASTDAARRAETLGQLRTFYDR